MFSAHLVFGDIDHSSEYPFAQRVKILEKFENVCLRNRPKLNSTSFYDVDNDAVMMGFSNLENFYSGNEVLLFVKKLRNDLLRENMSVSFGVNLIACGSPINWENYRGFIDDSKLIYIPDDLFNAEGRVIRSKLVGDSLIITQRILQVAKKTGEHICFSIFNHGHLRDDLYSDKLTYTILETWEQAVSSQIAEFLHRHHVTIYKLQ